MHQQSDNWNYNTDHDAYKDSSDQTGGIGIKLLTQSQSQSQHHHQHDGPNTSLYHTTNTQTTRTEQSKN